MHMKLARAIIFTNHFTQVFQVAPLFQTEEIARTFIMQHVTKTAHILQFGLYKTGPLTPLPVDKAKQYGELIAIWTLIYPTSSIQPLGVPTLANDCSFAWIVHFIRAFEWLELCKIICVNF